MNKYRVTFIVSGDPREAWTDIDARNIKEAVAKVQGYGPEAFWYHGNVEQNWWDKSKPLVEKLNTLGIPSGRKKP